MHRHSNVYERAVVQSGPRVHVCLPQRAEDSQNMQQIALPYIGSHVVLLQSCRPFPTKYVIACHLTPISWHAARLAAGGA